VVLVVCVCKYWNSSNCNNKMLLGGLATLHSTSGHVVFICVLVFLLIFEAGLHALESYCNKNGFKGLMQKLIREFMVMGLLSFGTYIATEYFRLNHTDWLDAFDFAHMVILFVAITFVCQAVGLIVLVNARSKTLQKYSAVSAEDLLAEYDSMEKRGGLQRFFYHQGPLSFPFPEFRSNIEYKIMEAWFINLLNLPPEFNFAPYMSRTLKKYVIALVEVRPINWLILSLLVLVNYARLESQRTSVFGRKCDFPVLEQATAGSGSESHATHVDGVTYGSSVMAGMEVTNNAEVVSESLQHECLEFLLRYVFFCIMMLVLYNIILLCFSELYMLRLLAKVTGSTTSAEEAAEKGEQQHNMLTEMHSLFAEWDYEPPDAAASRKGSNSGRQHNNSSSDVIAPSIGITATTDLTGYDSDDNDHLQEALDTVYRVQKVRRSINVGYIRLFERTYFLNGRNKGANVEDKSLWRIRILLHPRSNLHMVSPTWGRDTCTLSVFNGFMSKKST
jgi:hypothetical protein